MKDSEFNEEGFFDAIARSGARALLIGRRALVFLGLPVLTADYDFWVHIDDIDMFNGALEAFDLFPSRTAAEARRFGRYVLANDEYVDVLVARSVTTVDGISVVMEDVWHRRSEITLGERIRVAIPSIDDLIATKRFALRPRDVEDIRFLETLRGRSDA